MYTVKLIKNGIVGAVYIDLRDAFSRISHDKLIRKLCCQFKLSYQLCMLIFRNLVNRTFNFKNDETLHTTDRGVGQGLILGSLCFSAFVNDVKMVVKLLFLCYADDSQCVQLNRNATKFWFCLF